jgi:hypothetical protein
MPQLVDSERLKRSLFVEDRYVVPILNLGGKSVQQRVGRVVKAVVKSTIPSC